MRKQLEPFEDSAFLMSYSDHFERSLYFFWQKKKGGRRGEEGKKEEKKKEGKRKRGKKDKKKKRKSSRWFLLQKTHTRKHLLRAFQESFHRLSPECLTTDLARFGFGV